MAILVEVGRAAVATAIKAQSIHLAWGSGDPAWDASRPVESVSTTALTKEIGRRRVTQSMYCRIDPNGSIVVPGNRFEISNTPTKFLYLRFAYDFLDSPTETIRELGVFIGTVPLSSQPVGNASANPNFPDYLLAAGTGITAEYSDPGQLLVLEYIDKLLRSATIRQQFEFVIQF